MKKIIITIAVLIATVAVAYAATYWTFQGPIVSTRTIHRLADNETLLAGTATSDNDSFTSGVIEIGRCSGKIGLWIDVESREATVPIVRVELSPGVNASTYASRKTPTKLCNLVAGTKNFVEIDAPLAEYMTVVATNDGPGIAKITMYAFIK